MFYILTKQFENFLTFKNFIFFLKNSGEFQNFCSILKKIFKILKKSLLSKFLLNLIASNRNSCDLNGNFVWCSPTRTKILARPLVSINCCFPSLETNPGCALEYTIKKIIHDSTRDWTNFWLEIQADTRIDTVHNKKLNRKILK